LHQNPESAGGDDAVRLRQSNTAKPKTRNWRPAVLFEFDPSAIRAELKTEGDHWVVAIEMGTGRWDHKETSWSYVPVSRDEIRDAIGDDGATHDEEVIAYLELSLRRAGWRAARQGRTVASPVLEVWDLSPASDYVKPYNLIHRHKDSPGSQD
jgi:hypothetical protein